MRILLEAFGDPLLDRSLLRFSDRAGNLRPVLAQLAEDFYDVETVQFATEGVRSGRWYPLQERTVRQKQAQGYGSRGILERTLELEESLTTRTGRYSLYRLQADELLIGTTDPKAIFHQKGTRFMDPRPPVELGEDDKRGMVKRVQRYLVDGTVHSADFSVLGL